MGRARRLSSIFLTGIYQPTSGVVKFMGEDMIGLKPFQIAQSGIARTFQTIRLFKQLSALENVIICLPQRLYLQRL